MEDRRVAKLGSKEAMQPKYSLKRKKSKKIVNDLVGRAQGSMTGKFLGRAAKMNAHGKHPVMTIHIAPGVGVGPTKLAAFDSALNAAGIANYNLLRLSSVIPPNSKLVVHDATIPKDLVPGEWGDRLYVVMAEQRTDEIGAEAWAGIGWVQDPETRKGLFVEHEGSSEMYVRDSIQQSLNALMATRGINFGEIHMEVVGATCTAEPICTMVVAAYQASDWDNCVRVKVGTSR